MEQIEAQKRMLKAEELMLETNQLAEKLGLKFLWILQGVRLLNITAIVSTLFTGNHILFLLNILCFSYTYWGGSYRLYRNNYKELLKGMESLGSSMAFLEYFKAIPNEALKEDQKTPCQVISDERYLLSDER